MRRCVELDPERGQSCPFRGIAVQDPRSVVGRANWKSQQERSARSLPLSRARRRTRKLLALGMDRPNTPPKEDQRQTARDLRAAVIFGVVAATIELGVLLYIFR